MKLLPLHTLILLNAFLHSGSCSDGDGRCVPLFVRVGEKANIKCSITTPDQDGVYMYRQREENSRESMFYYYKDGTFTPQESVRGRVETNKNFRNFLVSISNVSEHDNGVYWCKFNKEDKNTFSERTCLTIQPGNIIIYSGKSECNLFIYHIVIGVLLLIIVVLAIVLLKLCCNPGKYTPKQHPLNGVYEVMRGNTARSLDNPAYESSQRRTHSDLS